MISTQNSTLNFYLNLEFKTLSDKFNFLFNNIRFYLIGNLILDKDNSYCYLQVNNDIAAFNYVILVI